MARGVVGAVLGLATAACSVVGVRAGTEEPAFQVVERHGDIQIRRYGPRVAAEVTVHGSDEQARSEGFRKLAAYIFGGNAGRASIAMTAPVDQTAAGEGEAAPGAWTIRFFMPAKYSLEQLPAPKDPAVRLQTVPGGDYAVLTFHGAWGPGAMRRREAELIGGLAQGSWRAQGQPSAWFYDPPWTLPALRRNEVAVRVARSG
jgi:hypothetical protein